MKSSILALGLLASLSSTFASEELIRQLTRPEAVSADQGSYDDSLANAGSMSLKVSPEHCERGRVLRGEPRPDYPTIIEVEKLCYQSASIDGQGNVVGFEVVNETLNRVNPRTAEYGSDRTFRFNFPMRHSQNMHISMTENAGIAGLMSHDMLESTVILLPRKVIPSMQTLDDGTRAIRRIQLPTSEMIDVDARTGEIVAGVITEAPMDMNLSRHARRFAGLTYTGRGLMIRADRRSGTPEHIYTQAFNQNERIKEATLTYRGKTCYVAKELIWANATNADLGAYFLYASDEEFLTKVVNPKCGWKLTLADLQ
jgi:hypothetical protein